MAPRDYDRYMIRLGMGTHPKFARLNDSERCAHVFGVLAVAAMSPVRGCLLVGELAAEAVDVAAAAGVAEKVADSAMAKLQAVGVLYRDDEHNCLRVHDWDDVNPAPRNDPSNADRQRRHRARNGGSNGGVTHPVTAAVTLRNAGEVEVEVEVEGKSTAARRRAPRKQADQDQAPVSLPGELNHAAHLVLSVLRGVHDQRGGLEPTIRGVGLAVAAFPDRPHLEVAHSVEHWLVAGNGRQADCGDVVARFRTFLKTTPPASRPASPSATVVAISPTIARMDAWKHAPEYQRGGMS